MSDMSPTNPDGSNPGNSLNPYDTPLSEITSPAKVGRGQVSITGIIIWIFVIPAIAANVVFWSFNIVDVRAKTNRPRPAIQFVPDYVGDGALFYLFALVPFACLLYGVSVGFSLYFRTSTKYAFLHPITQGIFQPFWFLVLATSGCFAVPAFLKGILI